MKKLVIISLILLTSCYGLRNIKTKNTEMVVKYVSPCDNGSCIYYLRPIRGSRFHGRVRIIDTIGKYSCGDKFILNRQ
jgi:hypothetical protein